MISMDEDATILILGDIRENHCITSDQRYLAGLAGGEGVYTAIGARIWQARTMLVSRVAEDFPEIILRQLRTAGINTAAVKRVSGIQHQPSFYACPTAKTRSTDNPVNHFLKIGQTVPKKLLTLQYGTHRPRPDEQSPLTIHPDDLPAETDCIQAVYQCPLPYVTQSILSMAIRDRFPGYLCLDPSPQAMESGSHSRLSMLLNNVDIFLPNIKAVHTLLQKPTDDYRNVIATFTRMGARHIVIKCGPRGQVLWDADKEALYFTPAYPVTVRDITGAGSAFAGGLLAGLVQTGDMVEAALRGSVSASMVIEGSGPLYSLTAYPGLAQARLSVLRKRIRRLN